MKNDCLPLTYVGVLQSWINHILYTHKKPEFWILIFKSFPTSAVHNLLHITSNLLCVVICRTSYLLITCNCWIFFIGAAVKVHTQVKSKMWMLIIICNFTLNVAIMLKYHLIFISGFIILASYTHETRRKIIVIVWVYQWHV